MNVPTPRLKAFTLIELLIVITIIGILSVTLIPRLTGGPAKARDAQRKAALQQIGTALEFYADDNAGAYPPGPACATDLNTPAVDDITVYLTSIPIDPLAGNNWDGETDPCAGVEGYSYFPVDGGFLLFAEMENVNATGTGLYAGSGVNIFDATAADSTNTNFTDNVANLCGTATCDDTSGVVYVFGR